MAFNFNKILCSSLFFTVVLSGHLFAQIGTSDNCGPNESSCVYFAPNGQALEQVVEELKKAQKSIRIATYNANIPEITEVLNQKLSEGLEVEFLVDYRLSWESNSVWRALGNYKNLKRLRIPVLRGGNPQMHNKIIIVDNQAVLFGSANWTYSGLVGNYENTIKLTQVETIKKFNDEIDELKSTAILACEAFAQGDCFSGGRDWDDDFHQYAMDGKLRSTLVTSPELLDCQNLIEGRGVLNDKNQYSRRETRDCLKSELWKKFFDQVTKNEKLVDGTQVWGSAYWSDEFKKRPDVQASLSERIYFGPEDNLEEKLLKELEELGMDPENSFAYISTNFITNRKLAEKLVELHQKKVHLKVFFDRGRYNDSNFKQMLEVLSPLGFTEGTDDPHQALITIFNNQISGSYGANHNKVALFYGPKRGPVVVTGSANWSVSAMKKNDENLAILTDPAIVSIYAKEILGELLVYRYSQNINGRGFNFDKELLSSVLPCLKMLLGENSSCDLGKGKAWHLKKNTYPIVIVLKEVPVNPEEESVWAWVSNIGEAVKLHTYHTFEGNYVNTLSLPSSGVARVKFFKAPKWWKPQDGLSKVIWEYPGMGNDRVLKTQSLALERNPGPLYWGRP